MPPAAVLGDRIVGQCNIHLVPGPTNPVPAGVLPFSAPLTLNLVPTVLIAGKPAAVLGSQGYNLPPHVGIVDPFAPPNTQIGIVMKGSATVLIGKKPAARTGDQGTCCGVPVGSVMGTAATVIIGG
jgi:uncharacterized Zn-binding protein involved in type VI secretion